MYERMLDKNTEPDEEKISGFLGISGLSILRQLETFLSRNYQLVRELRMPFGNNYGWGYKYSHKTKHLCYAFFERGAITVTLQLSDREVPVIERKIDNFLLKTQDLWKDRHPCGKNGGWVHYRVLNDDELNDVIELIKLKKKPIPRET